MSDTLNLYASKKFLFISGVVLSLVIIIFSASALARADTAPAISSVTASSTADGTSAVVNWMTDQPSNSRINYGPTSSYGSSTPQDMNLINNHSVTIPNLDTNTLYHFQASSFNASGTQATSSDMMFTTDNPNASSTATSTTATTTIPASLDLQTLQNEIVQLQQQVATLQQQVQNIMNNTSGQNNGGGGNSTGTTTSQNNSQASISPNSITVKAGGSVDFGGKGFGTEEPVTVTNNGNMVTSAHADGGGNFSTGSLSVPMTPGNQTYTFRGTNSGTTATANITVVP